MNKEDRDKKNYEIALLLKTEDDLPGVLVLVKQHNCELLAEPRAKKLALAYEIEGHTEAVFAYVNVSAYGEDAKNLELDLRNRQDVIRFMVLLSPPQSEKPTTAMPFGPGARRGRPAASYSSGSAAEAKPAAPRPLSNEALEKKIEEILQ